MSGVGIAQQITLVLKLSVENQSLVILESTHGLIINFDHANYIH